jgi:hypothetical protein
MHVQFGLELVIAPLYAETSRPATMIYVTMRLHLTPLRLPKPFGFGRWQSRREWNPDTKRPRITAGDLPAIIKEPLHRGE